MEAQQEQNVQQQPKTNQHDQQPKKEGRKICARCNRPERVCLCPSLPDSPIDILGTVRTHNGLHEARVTCIAANGFRFLPAAVCPCALAQVVVLQHPHELKKALATVPLLKQVPQPGMSSTDDLCGRSGACLQQKMHAPNPRALSKYCRSTSVRSTAQCVCDQHLQSSHSHWSNACNHLPLTGAACRALFAAAVLKHASGHSTDVSDVHVCIRVRRHSSTSTFWWAAS
eukprot:1159321-Pelagomonas_calceolata.AAC.5